MGELPCLGPLPGACLDFSKSRHGLGKIGQRFIIYACLDHNWSLPGTTALYALLQCLEPAWDHGPRHSTALPGACLGPCVAWSLPGTTTTIYMHAASCSMPGACLGPWTQAFYCIAWSLPGTTTTIYMQLAAVCLEPAWDHGSRYSAAFSGACLGPCVAWSLPGTTATGSCMPGACLGPQPLASCIPGAYLGPWPMHLAAMPGACLEPASCCIAWSLPGSAAVAAQYACHIDPHFMRCTCPSYCFHGGNHRCFKLRQDGT